MFVLKLETCAVSNAMFKSINPGIGWERDGFFSMNPSEDPPALRNMVSEGASVKGDIALN